MNGTTGYNNRSSQRCERECIRCRPGSHQRNRQFFWGGGWTSSNLLWSTGISSVCKKNITQVAVVMRAFAISNSSLLLQRSRSTLLSSTVVVSERPAWAASYMSESLTNVQSAGAGLQQQDQEHGRTVTRTPVAWENRYTLLVMRVHGLCYALCSKNDTKTNVYSLYHCLFSFVHRRSFQRVGGLSLPNPCSWTILFFTICISILNCLHSQLWEILLRTKECSPRTSSWIYGGLLLREAACCMEVRPGL